MKVKSISLFTRQEFEIMKSRAKTDYLERSDDSCASVEAGTFDSSLKRIKSKKGRMWIIPYGDRVCVHGKPFIKDVLSGYDCKVCQGKYIKRMNIANGIK